MLVPDLSAESWRVTHLPPMREAEGLFESKVRALFAVKDDPAAGLVVLLYRYRRLGSAEAFQFAGYAYCFNGRKWTIDEARSRLLVGVANVAQARKKLLAWSSTPSRTPLSAAQARP
ncbi:MAG: hypothetical protein IPL40_07595 [Proteobacteria bacterium]|nr:hypothetical protein [Pseudomonadota bacterium]